MLCFFQDVIESVVELHGARQIDVLISEIGQNPVYELELEGSRLALVHPGVGARSPRRSSRNSSHAVVARSSPAAAPASWCPMSPSAT